MAVGPYGVNICSHAATLRWCHILRQLPVWEMLATVHKIAFKPAWR